MPFRQKFLKPCGFQKVIHSPPAAKVSPFTINKFQSQQLCSNQWISFIGVQSYLFRSNFQATWLTAITPLSAHLFLASQAFVHVLSQTNSSDQSLSEGHVLRRHGSAQCNRLFHIDSYLISRYHCNVTTMRGIVSFFHFLQRTSLLNASHW